MYTRIVLLMLEHFLEWKWRSQFWSRSNEEFFQLRWGYSLLVSCLCGYNFHCCDFHDIENNILFFFFFFRLLLLVKIDFEIGKKFHSAIIKKNGLLGNVWKGFIWKFNKNLDSTGRRGWKRICFNDIHSRLVKFQIWPSIISYLFSLKTLTLRSHISVEKKIPKFFQIEAI